MMAYVDYRVVDSQDLTNQIFISCPDCGYEWGWCSDIRGTGNYDYLKNMSDQHNQEFHNG